MAPRRRAGCYEVSYREPGEGRERWHFQLDTLPPDARYRFPPGAMLARRWGQSERHGRATFWRLSAANALELRISDGFYGAEYALTMRGDSLVGLEQPFTDVLGSSIPAARISARRVPCALEAAPPSR